jgi:hypothetical protein
MRRSECVVRPWFDLGRRARHHDMRMGEHGRGIRMIMIYVKDGDGALIESWDQDVEAGLTRSHTLQKCPAV